MSFQFPKIVIAGGGSSGWIAAALLAKQLEPFGCEIELVESESVGTIGVGEATIPPIISFLNHLGIDEQDFIRSTQATFKLGIEFRNWHSLGQSYLHPFGEKGWPIEGFDFYQCWLKAKLNGEGSSYTDFSPAGVMGKNNRFFLPFKLPKESPLASAAYALHFDASLVGKYLSNYAQSKGVKRTEGDIVEVKQNAEGFLEKLVLQTGKEVLGDFFIDCTGFHSLLIEKTLKSDYENWQQWLPCDRAIVAQSSKLKTLSPLTLSTAHEAGWQWTIPLQTRTGNGYVHSSKHVSEEDAKATLLNNIQGELLHEPRVISFKTGARKEMWVKNCVSLGLSSGFLEPLESTTIHLVTSALGVLVDLLPQKTHSQNLADAFNKKMFEEYSRIRDFIILHYCTTVREDSEFWLYCKNMEIPQSLENKIALFRERALVQGGRDDFFRDANWYCIFEGMGVRPKTYDPFVDLCEFEKIQKILRESKPGLQALVERLPLHEDFIVENCKAIDAKL